jgi:hypothetical protein
MPFLEAWPRKIPSKYDIAAVLAEFDKLHEGCNSKTFWEPNKPVCIGFPTSSKSWLDSNSELHRAIFKCDGVAERLTDLTLTIGSQIKTLMQKLRRLARESMESRDPVIHKLKSAIQLTRSDWRALIGEPVSTQAKLNQWMPGFPGTLGATDMSLGTMCP